MASGLASIIGGLAQGITDFGKSAADMFGGAATNNAFTVGLDALLNKKSLEQASADARQRQNDYRKWLYDTDSTKDAAAKGLGTALNGAQAVMDFIPGIGQSAPVNALQGAIGGLADEFKFNGENYNLGNAAKRAAIGAGANAAAGGLGKALANSGSKVLSNGVLRGAAAGGLSGAISQGGNAAIEGGNADQILQSAAQGAKFGALMGAGTGGVQTLAGALKNARARSNAPAIMDEEVVMAELAPEQVYYHGSPETDITEFDINRAGKNTGSGEKAIFFTNSPSVADEYSYERKPTDSMFVNEKGKKGKVYRANLKMGNTLDLDNLTDDQIRELWDYATPLGKLNGQEDFIQKMTDWRDKYHNAQLTKGYLDLEALQNSPYDSFSARMYPNTDNTAKEYGVFNKDQISLLPDEEVVMAEMAPDYSNRIAEAQAEIENIGPVSLFSKNPEDVAKRTRIRELEQQIKAYNAGYDTPEQYEEAWKQRNAENAEREAKARAEQEQAQGGQDYFMAHRPTKSGAYGYDITAGGEEAILPANAYDNLGDYTGFKQPGYIDETITQLRAARNNPDAEMTIYRATPGDTINDGDWITLSKAYADEHNRSQLGGKGNVLSQKVPAKDIQFAGDDLMEWGYFPQNEIDAPKIKEQVMAERTAPGQLGLFDQTTTKAPETGYSQLGLFDQPTQPVTPKTVDVADVNPYAPVNGEVTQTMRDRASEIIDNLALKRQIPDNELFNRIDPATLPKGQQGVGKFLDEAYAKGLSHADIADMMRETVASEFDKRLGKAPNKEKLISFIFGDADETTKKEMMDKELGLYVAPETMSEGTLNSMARHKISDEIYGNNLSALAAGDRTLRGGYTGALDSVLSERLGIAPGNTYKKTGTYDTGDSLGRFQEFTNNPYKNNIMVRTALNNEDAINTMAHERLHSFQTEAKKLYDKDRYSPEVRNAYDELAKDLKRAKAYKTGNEIRNRYYGRNMAYWRHHDEQEARMLQQYLDAKGYTGSRHHNEKQYLGLEFDDAKITPAFDKFFDKLRELSKKGVALPAILATLGLGGYATQNQEEDKDNGQQI